MKKIIYTLIAVAFCTLTACDETNWLKEEPLDFYTSENSYTTSAQFQQSLNFLYELIREMHWNNSGDYAVTMFLGDLSYGGTDPDLKFNNWETWVTANTTAASYHWQRCYSGIENANVIINRLTLTEQVGAAEKKVIDGEAHFFRAYFYNLLANMYGGVPIVTDEPTAPRTDFVRATREQVYQQCKADLELAISELPDITAVKDGKLSKQAAQHLATEVYISLGEYQNAINSATAVISHPNMALMTSRFGTRAKEEGDPYWDLFQTGNQNRSTSSNTEAILVMQYEYKSAGSNYSSQFPRQMLPFYAGLQVKGKNGGNVLAFTDLTEEKGGRGIGVFHPTDHFLYDIWGDDFDSDYRNSSRMIMRDFRIDNPNAAGYGEYVVADGWLNSAVSGDIEYTKNDAGYRNFYPFVLKFSRVGDLPDDCYVKTSDGSIKQTALGEHVIAYQWGSLSANCTLRDDYLYRLAGTYLLRAEAYLGNNQKDLAAADINAVRLRSNASPCSAAEVDIDYILDEQLRELYFEDFRIPTLMRLGKMVERTQKYNYFGYNVKSYQDLFPIPYSEIERNTGATLEQNPGY